MADLSDETFQRVAIQKHWMTVAELQQCRIEMNRLKQAGEGTSLAQIALERGLVTRDQLQALEEQAPARESAVAVPEQIGPYVILAPLGKGAMGSVYRARHAKLGKEVALKVLPADLACSKLYVERFKREARLAAKLEHPNVVQVFDVGEDMGTYYLSMEYVAGRTAGDFIEQEGKMSEAQALRTIIDVSRALELAEEHNIIHRDIKPSNIMLDPGGAAKLGDLGIAKQPTAEEVPLTAEGAMIGTPKYMPPEQFQSAAVVDKRADFYALGATFYHLVTGVVAFPGESLHDVMIKVTTEPLVDPRERNPDLSEATAAVICRMMARDPRDRYASATEVRKALEAAAAASAAEASAHSSLIRESAAEPAADFRELSRAAKRARIGVTAALACMVLLLAGGAYWFFVRARPDRAAKSPAPAVSAPAAKPSEGGTGFQPVPAQSAAEERTKRQEALADQRRQFSSIFLKARAAESNGDLEKALELYVRARDLAGDAKDKQSADDKMAMVQQRAREKAEAGLLKRYAAALANADKAAASGDWASAISGWKKAGLIGGPLARTPATLNELPGRIQNARQALAQQRAATRKAAYEKQAAAAEVAARKRRFDETLKILDEARGLADDTAAHDKRVEAVRRRKAAFLAYQKKFEEFGSACVRAAAYDNKREWTAAITAWRQARELGRRLSPAPAALAGIPKHIKATEEARKREREPERKTFDRLLADADAAREAARWRDAKSLLEKARRLAEERDWLKVRAEEVERRLGVIAEAQKRDAERLAEYEKACASAKALCRKKKWRGAAEAIARARKLGEALRPRPESLGQLDRLQGLAESNLGPPRLITNSLGMALRYIPAGEFKRGSERGAGNERPVHLVKITRPFYLGVHQVTNRQYKVFVDDAGRHPPNVAKYGSAAWDVKGCPAHLLDHPVVCVSWHDAWAFCKWLGKREKRRYRLPTEAEWEYACRAGTTTRRYWGDDADPSRANYVDAGKGGTVPVGTHPPNPWGLHGMLGNANDWCYDRFDDYPRGPVANPRGPRYGHNRVMRGGWFGSKANRVTCSARDADEPSGTYRYTGFRVLMYVPVGE